jgi:hypothetical protein
MFSAIFVLLCYVLDMHGKREANEQSEKHIEQNKQLQAISWVDTERF